MFHSLRRLTLLLFTLLMLLALAPAFAQELTTYEDPEGRFTVPVPANWTVETVDGYTQITDPGDSLNIYVVVVDAISAEDGLAAAWEVVDPEFSLEGNAQTGPAPEGLDEVAQIIYESGDPNLFVLSAAFRRAGEVYALLVRGDATTFQQRASQVQIIATGLKITGIEEVNLADTEPLPITPEMLAELEKFINDNLTSLEIPGAAVAIVSGDEVIYNQGFGVKEMGGDDPITPETHMMIGSTGKTMTTLLMATLVDDGRMEWEEPVVELLPTFALADPERTRQIQMQHLVCACTGVPRRDFEFITNASEISAEDVIESLATFQFFTDFGEAFQYSNQMVATGGYLAALAAGGEYGDLFNAYEQAMQERVFGPIDMENTTFSFDTVQDRGNYATPHSARMDGTYYPVPLSIEKVLLPVAPAGSSWSTAEDMARYLITELNVGIAPDGTRVVSEENLRRTWEPQVDVTATTTYGLGWFVDDYKGLLMLHHGGNTLGFSSDLAFLPDADLGIVVLTNGQVSNIFNEAVRIRLLELVYDQPSQLQEGIDSQIEAAETALVELTETIGDSVDADAIEPYLGNYTSDVLGDVTVALDVSLLTIDAGEFLSELRPLIGEDAEVGDYILYDAPLAGLPVKFREQDDSLVMIIGAGVAEYTFTKTE